MINIAIDGPAGSGKTTIAKMLSNILGFKYLNTGAMYRSLGMFCFHNNKNCNNKQDVQWVCENAKLKLNFIDNVQHVIINGIDYNNYINEYQASKLSSEISKHSSIREKCVQIQRNFANSNNVVVEGRDIGSVVLPNADFKFFFEVSPEIRAERRYHQLIQNNVDIEGINYEKILEDIKIRDKEDTTRSNSPLIKMPDSIIVDCSVEMEKVISFILRRIYSKYPELQK